MMHMLGLIKENKQKTQIHLKQLQTPDEVVTRSVVVILIHKVSKRLTAHITTASKRE
jgi:hypothetical protein